MLASLRTKARSLLRKAGYDIHKIGQGFDAYSEIQHFTGNVARPILFDVGANIGQTISAFQRIFPSSTIHAFEPGTSAYATLNSVHRGHSNIILNNLALGASPGELPFFENSASVMSSFLPLGSDGWGKVTQRRTVKVTTLDDYCAQNSISRINVLKSDTQGFDLEVLKGSTAMFDRGAIDLIYLEITFMKLYENCPSIDQIYRFLVDREFELVSLYEVHYRNDRAGWTDGLFARKGHKISYFNQGMP